MVKAEENGFFTSSPWAIIPQWLLRLKEKKTESDAEEEPGGSETRPYGPVKILTA